MDASITALPDAAISFPMLGEYFMIDPPRYFPVFGWRIYMYGIIIALGFVLAVIYCLKRSREFGLTQDNVLDLVICCIPSAIIGARIFYVVTNPDRYFAPGKWGDIVKIWEGGLAIYGGLVLAIIVLWIYSRKKKVRFGSLLDIGALGLMIGQIIGRWGNFFNREAFGRETDIFCRMGLTTGGVTYYVHPTFLYESLWNLIGFVFIHFYSKKHRKFNGQLFFMATVWYGLGRTFIDGLRTDVTRVFGGTMGISQFIALVSFCASFVILALMLSKLRDAPALSASSYITENAAEAEPVESADVSGSDAREPAEDDEASEDTVDTDNDEKTHD